MTRSCRPNEASRRIVMIIGSILVCGAWVAMRFTSPQAPKLRTISFDRGLLNSEECTEACCQQFIPECDEGTANPFSSVPFAVQIILIVVLISFSALFSGLTLGLMGLDTTGLEIVMGGDDAKNAAFARKIYPLRKNGNLLLCTLLLGNVAVNALLSILLADKAGGIIGFLASTFLIVIFGEIMPQASCSRYALEIGSKAIPIVRAIMFCLWPVAAPMAFALDWALGEELATTYSSAEMLKLLQIHVQHEAIDPDIAIAMTGALKYKDTKVKDVMTPLENVYMLSVDKKLNFETIAEIFKTGYSRIPVFEISRNNVIGLLFVKDLIFCDPEDEVRVSDFVELFGRGMHVVWPDDNLGDVLRELKLGKSHMALVRDVNNNTSDQDPFYEVRGIITLEDIIEEIIGDEIVDETDAYVDGTHMQAVDRAEGFKWARLRLLDSKLVDEKLTLDEAKAVTAHLLRNYSDVVSLLSENQLERLVASTSVSLLPTAQQEVGEDLPKDLVYIKGELSDFCLLILSGKMTVYSGLDNFRSDVSSWCLLGAGALSIASYKPDFSAFVSSGPCRCLRITRDRFNAAIDGSFVEKHTSTESTALELSLHSRFERHLIPVPSTKQGLEASADHIRISGRVEPEKRRLFKALRVMQKGRVEGSSNEGSGGNDNPVTMEETLLAEVHGTDDPKNEETP